jgi:hypothetical protein
MHILGAQVGAVLYAGQPSVQTLGVADVLFGAAPPAGRMVQTLYPGECIGSIVYSMVQTLYPGE